MSKSPERPLTAAQMEVTQARARLASTIGELRYRLSPGTVANNAWEGMRGKSSELAEGAVQAVKERPVTASGILAAVLVFLARDSLWSLISGWLRGDADEDMVTTHLDETESHYDLAAPKVGRPVVNEGANA